MTEGSIPVLLIAALPTLLATIVYFVRIETRLAKISRDLCWIKRELRLCQPPSGDPSP